MSRAIRFVCDYVLIGDDKGPDGRINAVNPNSFMRCSLYSKKLAITISLVFRNRADYDDISTLLIC